MRVKLLLAAAVCSVGFGCSTDDGTGGPVGSAGQPSGTAGTATSGGTASTAGTTGTAGTTNTSGGTTGTAGTTSTAGTTGTAGSVGTAGTGTGGTGSGGSGGGGSGGGSAGSAGSGSGGGGTVMGCSGLTGIKFCDDWDKAAMGKPTGDFSVGSTVTVDATKAYSGTQSLHFVSPKPGSAKPNITFTKQFPLASNDLWGRAMIFMSATPTTDSHWDFITSNNNGNTQWSIGGQASNNKPGNFELVCDPPDNGLDSKTVFPTGKWFCLQWEFKYPGNDDTTFLAKVDGTAVDQGMFTGANSKGEKWKAGTWTNLKVGWEIFGSSNVDIEYWIDDLAFGEMPIACPTK